MNSYPNRLKWRHRAIIEFGREAIEGQRIVDIASYDGRWAFAALHAGARHVTGIEIQPGSVFESNRIMKEYGAPDDQYIFIAGEVNSEMKKLEPAEIDTVFCLGFFYHTLYHMTLLDEIKRLEPDHLIFDTHVSKIEGPVIEIKVEDVKPGGARGEIYPTKDDQIIVGWPSTPALEMMFAQIGYEIEYFDWFAQGIEDWS